MSTVIVPSQERKRKTVNLTLPLTPLPQYAWDNGLIVRNGSRPVPGDPDANGGSMLASIWAEFLGSWENSSTSSSSSSPLPRSPDTPLPSSAILVGEDGVERVLRSTSSPLTPQYPSASASGVAAAAPQGQRQPTTKLKPAHLKLGDSPYYDISLNDTPLPSDSTLYTSSPVTAICLTTPQASKSQGGVGAEGSGSDSGHLPRGGKGRGASRLRPLGSGRVFGSDHNVAKSSPLRPFLSPQVVKKTSNRTRDQPDVPIDCV